MTHGAKTPRKQVYGDRGKNEVDVQTSLLMASKWLLFLVSFPSFSSFSGK
jgi:hypothetical protein